MSVELVRRIKVELEANGQTWKTNEDAAQITFRVAWALRDQGAKLIVKHWAGQNGAIYKGVKYAVDAIALPTGWIDCLASAGPPENVNRPVWQATGVDPNATLVEPFDPDAGFVSDPPVRPTDPLPDVPPSQPDDLAAVLEALAAFTLAAKGLREDRATIDADLMDALAKVRSDLTDLRLLWAKGLTGTVFGMRVTLKP